MTMYRCRRCNAAVQLEGVIILWQCLRCGEWHEPEKDKKSIYKLSHEGLQDYMEALRGDITTKKRLKELYRR